MKDNFSKQSKEYSVYRPVYPTHLYDFILSLVDPKKTAWDCATGNGQVAGVLAKSFEKVYGTDISANQIANAVKKPNIEYSIQPAEKTNFPNHTFDLITVGQAVHWFQFDQFYKEVKRVLKPGGVLVLIGYGLNRSHDETDKVVDHLYHTILDGCWDKERNYIDENYATIPFPFEQIKTPDIVMTTQWTVEHFIGYLGTWSGVQHYIKKNGKNPLELIESELRSSWGQVVNKQFEFPLLLKVAHIN